tara:strand:- start:48 stop:365 length:318 start_codon:yes stop_codon:yes gene_type:complete
MAATFTWKIEKLQRQLSDGFVFYAKTSIICSEGEGEEEVSVKGSFTCNFQQPDTLVPYEDLTEEQVIGWVKTAMGGEEAVTAYQNELQMQLNELKAPTEATGTPW